MGFRWVFGVVLFLLSHSLTAQNHTTEIKVVLEAKAWQQLGLELKRARHERVYFLDTPDLQVQDHDLVLRIRSRSDGRWDSTVKLRPLRSEIPANWRRWKKFKHESDIVGSKVIDSAAYTTETLLTKLKQERFKSGDIRIKDLFSRKQIEIIRWRWPGLPLDQLRIYGPIEAHTWDLELEKGLIGKLERWTMRGRPGFEIVEFSVKVPDFYTQCHEFLRRLNLRPSAHPKTKTSMVLSLIKNRPLR